MQVFGGMGVCQDALIPHVFTQARFFRIADGPDEVHMSQLGKLTVRRSSPNMADGNRKTSLTSRSEDRLRRGSRLRLAFALLHSLTLASLTLSSLGCSDSSAVASGEACFDEAPLPLGTSVPPLEAVCGAPPAALAMESPPTREHLAAERTSGSDEGDLTIVLCGTGTPIPSNRTQSCTAVMAGGQFLLFDAGDGAQRSIERLGLPSADLEAVFLTHFHSDHIADLGEVISRSWILGRDTPLTVYGGESVARVVEGFNAIYALDDNYRVAHHGEEVLPPEFAGARAVTIEDPGPTGRVVYERGGVTVRAFVVNHPPIEPAFGYRIDYAGRTVVVSGDTTETRSLLEMSRNADVLVAEVMNFEAVESLECALEAAGQIRNATFLRDIRTYHIGTRELAELAEEAGVATLVLTHLVPTIDNGDPRVETLFTAPMEEIFRGELIAGDDGTRLVVP